jgi:hypothetical protein
MPTPTTFFGNTIYKPSSLGLPLCGWMGEVCLAVKQKTAPQQQCPIGSVKTKAKSTVK